MCMASKDCKLQERVDAIDGRVTDLERTVAEMRSECREGFSALGKTLNDLGHDFGSRMNTLDQKVVDEKAKWGEAFRKWLDRVVNLLIVGCGVAMGVTAYAVIFGKK